MLQCGFYELDITPPLNNLMPGSTGERRSSGIKDPIFVKAMVLETGDAAATALVGIDALFVPDREVRQIRQRVYEVIGIQPENIMVAANHTHTGPPLRADADGVMPDEYLAFLADKAADAVVLAYNNRQPARIGCGLGHLDSVSFNRRYWMKDGSLQTNPGYMNPNIVRAAGPIDPDVTVVRIEDLEGKPLGVVTSFSCHSDTVGGSEYSGDYSGELSRQLKAALGERVVSLFMLGACGDINHVDVSKPKPDGDKTSVEMYKQVGQALAAEVLRIHESLELQDSLEMSCSRAYVPMELRKPTPAEMENALLVYNGPLEARERFFALHVLRVAVMPDTTAQVEIQLFRLGDLAIVGLPGEIFVELGLAIKAASPYKKTVINTLSNGSIYGYVCTREAYEQGGYEPKLKTFSRIPAGSGELWVEKAIELLHTKG